jgi:hypothetical protein
VRRTRSLKGIEPPGTASESLASFLAIAVAAFFTDDAVPVTPEGPIYGRETIERHSADLFTQIHVSEHINKTDRRTPSLVNSAYSN